MASVELLKDLGRDARAKQFINFCKEIMLTGGDLDLIANRHTNNILGVIAKSAIKLDSVWSGADAKALAANYLASIQNFDALELLKQYASVLPANQTKALVASGFVADNVAEGALKAISDPGLDSDDMTPMKPAGILAVSKELMQLGGQEAQALFERELRNGVTAGSNAAVASAFNPSSVEPGTDAKQSLALGLAAAEPSMGYVVLCDWSVVKELAVNSDGRMSVSGGEFSPGIHIVGRETQSDDAPILVLPGSRCAVIDHGLSVVPANHANILLDGVEQSLWQRNLLGLLCERPFAIHAAADAVSVDYTPGGDS